MLEQMRKNSRSLVIYAIFGLLIAIFVISFGPQSRGVSCEASMSTNGDEVAARVGGDTVSAQAFRAAFKMRGGDRQPPQVLKMLRFRETVMDGLIERELLADEAEHVGFSVSEDDVHKLLVDGKMMGLGVTIPDSGFLKDGVFNYDRFKNYLQFDLGLTPDRFVELQRREMLAQRMRDFMRASVTVSPEEIKTSFETKNRQVNLEYVRFPARKYEGEVEPTADETAAYVKANEAKLKDMFTQRKALYTDMQPEAHVRQILVKVSDEGEDAAKAAATAAAKKKADGLATRIAKGEAFAKVAREASDDTEARAKGGDLGWRRKGGLGLEAADETKVFEAKPGEVVGPVKTSAGWVLLTTVKTRKGTLGFDDVKDELAAEQIKQEKAVGIAKERAEAALALAKAAPDKSFKDVFAAEPPAEPATKPAKPARPGAAAAAKADPRAALGDLRPEETGLFSRRGTVIEQIGDSPDLAKAVWELKPEAPLAGPFDVAGSFVVVRLKERKDPDAAELEKKKAELQRDAELLKWNEVVNGWVKSRCLDVKGAGRLTVNKGFLKYDENGPDKEAPSYEPCGGGEHPRRPS